MARSALDDDPSGSDHCVSVVIVLRDRINHHGFGQHLANDERAGIVDRGLGRQRDGAEDGLAPDGRPRALRAGGIIDIAAAALSQYRPVISNAVASDATSIFMMLPFGNSSVRHATGGFIQALILERCEVPIGDGAQPSA